MIKAKDLRNSKFLEKVPNDKPGYYKWWANEKELNLLLKNLGTSLKTIESNYGKKIVESKLLKDSKVYCIYVGIAVNESIQKRLNWHVNDEHSARKVKNGTLSTLRQSISSAIFHDQYNKDGTNKFIDKLMIEYFSVDKKIKSKEAKIEIEKKEKTEINNYLRVLNIRDNKNGAAKDIIKNLKRLRKESK